MSTVAKDQTVQRINYTLAGSAAISLASLYFNATRVGRVANCALVLSIAARVLAGNVESAVGESVPVTPSQAPISNGASVLKIIDYGVSSIKALNDLRSRAREWALTVKAEERQANNQGSLSNSAHTATLVTNPVPVAPIVALPSTPTQTPAPSATLVPNAAQTETPQLRSTVVSSLKKFVRALGTSQERTGCLLTQARDAVAKPAQPPKETTPQDQGNVSTAAQPTITAAETTTPAASQGNVSTAAQNTITAAETTTTPAASQGTATDTTTEQAPQKILRARTKTPAPTTIPSKDPAQVFTTDTVRTKKVRGDRLHPITQQKQFESLETIHEDSTNTPLVPRTPQEETAQLEAATKASLQAPPRVECDLESITTGTMNQSKLPDGATACTSIAATALIAMFTGKLETPEGIDEVLQAGVGSYKQVLSNLEGFKTDANQNQLLGWDQCYHGGFKTVLQSPENKDRSLPPSSIALSADKNSYSEALQALKQKAMSTGKQQGAILIMYPFTYAVSITPSRKGPVIQLFDSHGSLAYDVLGGSNSQASIATFKSIEQLAGYLNAKRPFDPDAQKPERNQFGFYMCQLRSEAEATTDASSQPASNDAQALTETERAQKFTKVIQRMNSWEQGFEAQIAALQSRTDHTSFELAALLEKLEKAQKTLDAVPDATSDIPEHAHAINEKLQALRAKLEDFERLHIERCNAQLTRSKPQTTPAPATVAPQVQATQAQVVQKPQPTTISKEELAQCTVFLTEAQQNIALGLQELKAKAQSAEALKEQAQLARATKQWIESERQRLSNASNPNSEIQQVLTHLGEYDQQLTQFEQLLAQKQAIQSTTSLDELLTHKKFVKNSLELVSQQNAGTLIYCEPDRIAFLKQEIPSKLQCTTELQAKVAAFLKEEPNNQNAGNFNQELLALKSQLTALQDGLKDISLPNSVQTATKALKALPVASETHKAQIGKWSESIAKWTDDLNAVRAQLKSSDFNLSQELLADLLGKTNPIHTRATELQQSIITLQGQQQAPLKSLTELLGQIQEIITDAQELAHDIEREQLQPAPVQTEPPAAKKSLLARLLS